MGRYPTTIETCTEKLCEHIKNEEFAMDSTVRFYRNQVQCVFRILHQRDETLLPYTITKEDVKWLLDTLIDGGYAVNTIKGYMQALRRICIFYKNKAVHETKYKLQYDTRPNADWLTLEQGEQLVAVKKTIPQELVIHLELCTGLRRIEVARLKTSSIKNRHLDVLGKGRMGGKPRIVPFHKDTQKIIDMYAEYRHDLLTRSMNHWGADVEIPDQFMIWIDENDILHPYSTVKTTGIDKIVAGVEKSLPFHFSNHTLRRTFGRTLHKAKAPLVSIMKLLGHDDVKTTIQYLGLNFDDMTEAMELSPFSYEFSTDKR